MRGADEMELIANRGREDLEWRLKYQGSSNDVVEIFLYQENFEEVELTGRC